MHPTSLPSGRLDDDVLRWLDFMHDAGLSVWQVLPLVIPDRSRSPYQSCSAFACNPALLPLDPPAVDADRLQSFRTANAYWIEDFALFSALSERFKTDAWWSWPTEYARRDASALAKYSGEASSFINSLIMEQYLLDLRWREIRTAAAERGIVLFGDMPIFVAHESVDVWAQPSNFLLDDEFQPRYVTGVPPDYFSTTGQRWGNPHYDWQLMRQGGFSWWQERMQRQFEWFDILRLDHFRALSAVWMIEASCDSAIEGVWRETPGRELLQTIQATMGHLPIVAEDLGFITDDVRRLRHEFSLPGMAVLQFAFDGSTDNPHRPENITTDTVAYTGTHDNNTCVGWYESLDDGAKEFVFNVLNRPPADDIAGAMIDVVFESPAQLAIVPLQDFLRLGSQARMNTPGVAENNWQWKFQWHQVDDQVGAEIRRAMQRSARMNDDR